MAMLIFVIWIVRLTKLPLSRKPPRGEQNPEAEHVPSRMHGDLPLDRPLAGAAGAWGLGAVVWLAVAGSTRMRRPGARPALRP